MINDKLFLEEFDDEPIEESKKTKRRRRAKKVPYSYITYTTGDIGLNIDRFNTAMGTADLGDSGADTGASEGGAMVESFKLKEGWEDFNLEDRSSDDVVTVVIADKRFDPLFKKEHKESLKRNNIRVEGQYFNGIVITGKVGDIIQVCDECQILYPNKIFMEALSLTEAKRYVRRYYIRPQNIFCSNKAEILKVLVDIGDQNCTVYTLNNLGDDKDVNKLTSHDIIYTYDDGILKDKNGVRVLDYDLSIKKEENRRKLTNPDPSTKEFKTEYEDRITAATELEEELDDSLLATCPYDIIGADYNDVGDEFIVSLNHNVNDIEEAAEELAAWIQKTYKISVLDWHTNGSNVFIFELSPDNVFNMDFEDINVFGESLKEAKERTCCYCGGPLDSDAERTDLGMACEGCSHHFNAIGG